MVLVLSKIKIKAIIISDEETIKMNSIGEKLEAIIDYEEHDHTHMHLDMCKDELIRENANMYMHYRFKENAETVGQVLIKECDQELDVILKTLTIVKRDNFYSVEYLIDNNKFIYEVNFSEV